MGISAHECRNSLHLWTTCDALRVFSPFLQGETTTKKKKKQLKPTTAECTVTDLEEMPFVTSQHTDFKKLFEQSKE